MNEFLFNSPEYNDLKKEIDSTLEFLDSGIVISEEGFGNVVKKILTSIVDKLILHVSIVFKNAFSLFNIDGIFTSLIVNSPVEEFNAQHKTKWMLLFNDRYLNDYIKIRVVKPRGMKASYEEVLNTNENILKSLNMIPFIKAINNDLGILSTLLKKSTTTPDQFRAKLAELVKSSTANEKTLVSLSKEHDVQFGGDQTKESVSSFIDEFGDTKTFKKYCERLVEVFSRLKDTKKIREEYTSQSLYIRQVVDLIETNDYMLNKESLKLLISYFQYIASCYQLFGSVCVSQMAMEGNMVIILNEMLQVISTK